MTVRTKPPVVPCSCPAYPFPHRPYSGVCIGDWEDTPDCEEGMSTQPTLGVCSSCEEAAVFSASMHLSRCCSAPKLSNLKKVYP